MLSSFNKAVNERLAESAAKLKLKRAETDAGLDACQEQLNATQNHLNTVTQKLEELKKRQAAKKASKLNNSSTSFSSNATSSLASSQVIPSITSIPLIPTPSSYTPAGKKY